MKSVSIKGELRTAVGKKDSKRLRSEGKVPCVMYGTTEPVHFNADFSEFRKVVYTPDVFLINLEVSGNTHLAIIQDIQWHPVKEEILHVDFLQISEDKAVKIDVPVRIEGYAKGMRSGGKMKLNLRRLRVKALAKDLPDNILLNIDHLELGETIKVGEVEVPNLEILNAKSNPVVSIAITRAARAAMNAAKTAE